MGKVEYSLTPNTPTVYGLALASWLLWGLEASFFLETFGGANLLSTLATLAAFGLTPLLLFTILEKVVFLLFVRLDLREAARSLLNKLKSAQPYAKTEKKAH